MLYRQLPKLKRYLAYLPEGPVIDWAADDLAAWLAPMTAHLKEQGAFGVRMGPPVVTRRWTAAPGQGGIADAAYAASATSPPHRARAGRRPRRRPARRAGLAAAGRRGRVRRRPAAVRLPDPARRPDARRTCSPGMNQLWRRNIKKADKAGVEVTSTRPVDRADLKAFHDLYVHTAERDHFTPRPLAYFRSHVRRAAAEEPDRIRLYLARHEGDLVAATIAIRVGAHAWYSYGAPRPRSARSAAPTPSSGR